MGDGLIFDNSAVIGYAADGFIALTDARFWMTLAVVLFAGVWIGVTYGRRTALKDIYKRFPVARNDMLLIGLEDPAKPWWRWRPLTYVLLGAASFVFVLTIFIDEPAPVTAGLQTQTVTTAQQAEAAPPAENRPTYQQSIEQMRRVTLGE
jgi:hypothetical protein